MSQLKIGVGYGNWGKNVSSYGAKFVVAFMIKLSVKQVNKSN